MLTALLIALAALVLIFIDPFLGFVLGYIIGKIICWTFGQTFVSGLSLLNINILTSQIPLLCGTLGVVGSFFKTHTAHKS